MPRLLAATVESRDGKLLFAVFLFYLRECSFIPAFSDHARALSFYVIMSFFLRFPP